jgi:hypothetical protein
MDDYFDEYNDIDTSPSARGPEYFRIIKEVNGNKRLWAVRQILADPEGDNAFAFDGVIDLDASDEAGDVRFSRLEFSQS